MKTDNDDRWFKQMRDRLDGYEEPVGDELWRRIEKDMPERVARRSFGRSLLRISVSVAACAAVLAGLWIWWPDDAAVGLPEMPVVAERSQEKPVPDMKRLEASDLRPAVLSERPERMAVAESFGNNVPAQPSAPKMEEDGRSHPRPLVKAVRAADSEQERKDAEKGEDFTAYERTLPVSGSEPAVAVAAGRAGAKKKWSVAVAVSNGFSSGGDTQGGFAPLAKTNAFGLQSSSAPVQTVEQAEFRETYYNILSSNIETPTRTSVHYDLPITYSATFRYKFTDRWALDAGLSFTKLNSDWRSGSDTHFYTSKQSAYFVGIPVSASFTFFDSRYVSLYALAGGSVEKCVAGSVKTVLSAGSSDPNPTEKRDLEGHPWQFSVMAGAGLQFNITEHYGIFAEPAASCYFGKGELATVRTDRDVNFQLTLGLRVSY